MTVTNQPIEFPVADLIAGARKVLDAHRAAKAEVEAAEVTYREQHQADWLKHHTERIRLLRDHLTVCLRKGTVPRMEDINHKIGPAERYTSLDGRFFYPGVGMSNVHKPPAYHADTTDLAALVEMLETHTGDTVTASQLRNLGFKSKSVISLFRDIASAKRAEAKALEEKAAS